MSLTSGSMSEEDDDELPAISVNSSSQDMSAFVMPSADVLASQRAREEECEREILMLRAAEGAADSQPLTIALSRSDSSGSEGEALAAAVSAMLVQPGPGAGAGVGAARERRVEPHVQVLRHVPDTTGLIAAYLVLLDGDLRHAKAVVYDMVCSVSSAVQSEDACWRDELVSVAVLLACTGAPAGAGGLAARAALHRLLDDWASDHQIEQLCAVLVEAARQCGRDVSLRALLELSDSVRSGACARADTLANRLVQAGIEVESVEESAAAQYTRLQLAGRALAAGSTARPAPPPPHKHRAPLLPEQLKVVVGAAKLQLLFRDP